MKIKIFLSHHAQNMKEQVKEEKLARIFFQTSTKMPH